VPYDSGRGRRRHGDARAAVRPLRRWPARRASGYPPDAPGARGPNVKRVTRAPGVIRTSIHCRSDPFVRPPAPFVSRPCHRAGPLLASIAMKTRPPVRLLDRQAAPCAEPRVAGRHAGFTLLELMIALTVAAVLFSIAIPSFQYVTASNRVSSEVNAMLGDMQFARAEAIKEGQTVTICSSNDGTTCSGTTTWTFGWIVFNDPNNNKVVDAPGEVVMRVQKAMGSGDTFVANNNLQAVTFNREGFALGLPAGGVTLTLHNSTAVTAYSRCLALTLIGQMTTQLHGTGACL
jgi:type IV fimbrial biogenesis protein FimT